MSRFCTRLAVIIAILHQFSATAPAGVLDDYYLQQFVEAQSISLQKAVLSLPPEAQEPARCGMPLKHALKRDWNLLEQSTQKVLAKQLAYPALAGEAIFTTAHFKVHYAASGADAPPSLDVNGIIGVPDWVEAVAAIFESVYTDYQTRGYQPAPTTAGVLYDIYLRDLAPQKYYGVSISLRPASVAAYPNAYSSWIELDNNFTDSIYSPYTPLQSLQITAAHEYHHAIQYGYNYYFDVWHAEATSTWMEDELYDGVNQLYNYIPEWFNNSNLSFDTFILPPGDTSQNLTLGYGYGRWIFNRYLAEKHGPAMLRAVWEKVGGLASPGVGSDIPMAPVLDSTLSAAYNSSLSSDFLGFAKRVYTRDWTTQPADIPKIHLYSPLASYSLTASTPVNAIAFPAPTVTLPHYSFAYYRFIPAPGAPDSLSITITGTSGIKAAAFIKNSGGVITEYPFAAVNGTTITVPGFNSSSEAVLLIANVTDSNNHSANFSTDGTGLPVTEPSGGTVYPPLQPAAPVNAGGGGGCFIATAAYGSYLHPQVQLLRNFRDEYLLTNAPGRAFVALYYHYSPPLADVIARHPLLRGIARLALTPFVAAVAHPMISLISLFLLPGAWLLSYLGRRKTARSNVLRNNTSVT